MKAAKNQKLMKTEEEQHQLLYLGVQGLVVKGKDPRNAHFHITF
jgi:hypothetical protein